MLKTSSGKGPFSTIVFFTRAILQKWSPGRRKEFKSKKYILGKPLKMRHGTSLKV